VARSDAIARPPPTGFLSLDNKQYWRLDVDNGNVIKPDAPTYLLEGGLQANKLCLFSYEKL
jgi:hypothetical protein